MPQLIFAALLTLLSLSDQAMHTGCNAPIPQATECWIVSPSTGVTAWITPTTITYTEQ